MLRRLALVLLLLVVIASTIGGIVAWSYVRRWDAIVSEKFLTHRWIFPSKIYADSALIYPGMDLQAAGFLLSYQSEYLRERNWIQICLMGDCSRQSLVALLTELRKVNAVAPELSD